MIPCAGKVRQVVRGLGRSMMLRAGPPLTASATPRRPAAGSGVAVRLAFCRLLEHAARFRTARSQHDGVAAVFLRRDRRHRQRAAGPPKPLERSALDRTLPLFGPAAPLRTRPHALCRGRAVLPQEARIAAPLAACLPCLPDPGGLRSMPTALAPAESLSMPRRGVPARTPGVGRRLCSCAGTGSTACAVRACRSQPGEARGGLVVRSAPSRSDDCTGRSWPAPGSRRPARRLMVPGRRALDSHPSAV